MEKAELTEIIINGTEGNITTTELDLLPSGEEIIRITTSLYVEKI